MKPKTPIFIIGCPRSGTTLLRLMLDKHTQIAVPDETAIFSFLYHYPGRPKKIFFSAKGRQSFLEKLEQDLNLQKALGTDVIRLAISGLKRKERLNPKLVIDSLFAAYLRERGKAIWGEKTPLHACYIGDILKVYPQAAIIYVLRDPRAVAASMKRYVKKKRGKDLDFWMTEDPQKAALMWLDCYQNALKFQDKIYLLRYEDLIESPVKTLKDLTEKHLNISYEPAMLRYYEGAEGKIAGQGRKKIPVWHKALTHNINPANAERWHQELTPDEIFQVELILQKQMQKAGYEPENNFFPRPLKFAAFIKKFLCLGKNKVKQRLKFVKDRMLLNDK